MNTSAFTTVFVALGVISLVYLALVHVLFQRLASKHMRTWESLGSPTLFGPFGIGSTLKVMRFLLRGEYASLDDIVVTRLARVSTAILIIGVVVSLTLQVIFYSHGSRA